MRNNYNAIRYLLPAWLSSCDSILRFKTQSRSNATFHVTGPVSEVGKPGVWVDDLLLREQRKRG